MNKIPNIIKTYEDAARQLLDETGSVKIIDIQKKVEIKIHMTSIIVDIQIKIKIGNELKTLNIRFLEIGAPRIIRKELLYALVIQAQEQNSYFIFMAPYLSDESLGICNENNIGGIDISGNAFLKFNNNYIYKTGFRNKFPERRKDLYHSTNRKEMGYYYYTKKEIQVLRTLSAKPKTAWTIIGLAKTAKVSYGLCWRFIQKLKSTKVIEESAGKIKLKNIKNLFTETLLNNHIDQDYVNCFYSRDTNDVIVDNIVKYFTAIKLPYAFTKIVALSLIANEVNHGNVDVYVNDLITDKDIITNLKLTTTPFYNATQINIIKPGDSSIFWYPQIINKVNICSDFQLYLDLVGDNNPLIRELAKKIKERM